MSNSQYDNTNRGVLYINDRKEQPNHPDRTGTINVDGKDYWLNGWIKDIKQGKNAGQKMLSLSIKPKEPQGQSNNTNNSNSSYGGAAQEDINF